MNLLHLKYAVEVATVGSINKAAENLYINQPNLSRAIKELEESLGITVFERTSKGMYLTARGEEFIGYAKQILHQVDEVESIFTNDKGVKRHFSISVPRASYISEAFSQFSKKLSKEEPLEIFYKETNALRAIKNVLQSDYKLGIIRYAAMFDRQFEKMLEEKSLRFETVTEFNYVLIMSKNHKLAEKENVFFSDLTPFTEIAHADPFVPSLPMSAVKKEELPDNIDKRIFVFERASQFDLLSTDTSTFMWVSPVPEETLNRYNLIQKQCEDNKKIYKDVLIYQKDYKLTDIDRLFITELCDAKRKNM